MKTLILIFGCISCLNSFSQEQSANIPHCTVNLEELLPPDCDKESCGDFKVVTSCMQILEFDLRIYDRWGETIYESTDHTAIWDTQDIAMGVYIWQIAWTDTGAAPQRAKGQFTITK
ncbi:gliding motility-associated C-terminal domain-containing protein [Crocinitomix catalasitica]|nr:gliding motility-associated C-terminal domain-containing protein [Crocinitomix catalasitica]